MKNINEVYNRFLKYKRVCTDTRKVEPGAVFFALKGANFNGNKFAEQALKSGCSCVVIDDPGCFKQDDRRYILVEDALKALQLTAKRYRQELSCKVVAITGSNGKTTTKELMSRVLSKKYRTHSTPGNFNNHIGLPLTVLGAQDDCEVMILEMGDNQPGDIAELCEIALPDYGLITNIGKDHIDGYGSFEGNVKSKKELFDYLGYNNKQIVFDKDETSVAEIAVEFDQKITIGSGTQYQLEEVSSNPFISYKVDGSGKIFQTKMIGSYNVANMRAAYAIGKIFEVPDEDIHDAVCTYTPGNNRSQWIETDKGNKIILDAYNANPSSVLPALKNLDELKTDLPKVTVLGDMLELGSISDEEHANVVSEVIKYRFSKSIFVGSEFKKATSGHTGFVVFHSVDDALTHVSKTGITGCVILIKGSRSLKMERFVEYL